jgi:hypothetical protein
MLFSKHALAIATLTLCASLAKTAAAGDLAAAETTFKAGKDAMARGDYEVACARFQESHDLDPAPGTAFNLAECEEKRGNIATAWGLYEAVRQRLARGDDRIASVAERAKALEARLPKLTIKLAANVPATAIVKRKGELQKSLGQAIPVDPGRHELTLEVEGHAPSAQTVELAERETKDVTLELGAALPTDAPPPEKPALPSEPRGDGGSALRIAGIVIGGVGLAAVGGGVAMAFVAQGQYDDAEPACPANRCTQQGFDDRNAARGLGDGATAMIAVGGAAAATGLVLAIVGFTQTTPDEQAFTVAPSFSEAGAGLAFGGVW